MSALLRRTRGISGATPPVASNLWSTDIAPFVNAGDAITIPVGTSYLWDVTSTPNLGSLTINGTLVADPTKDVGMTVSDVTVSSTGTWKIAGSLGSDQYTHVATVTINGARTTHTARPNHPTTGVNQGYTNDGSGRAVNNRGVRFWKAGSKSLPKTKLAATAAAGATSIYVVGDCTDWAVGDSIVIAPTNFYGQSVSERKTVTSVSSYDSANGRTQISFSSSPLVEKHWGQLQYPIDAAYGVNAMSLTPGTFTAPDADTPTVYDVRAEVLNLSSGNIVVQAPADTAWTTQGWGVHTMDHPGSTYYDEGVRIIRGGQRGALGRYPFHSHSLSYTNQRSSVTFDRSGPIVLVNWTGHGITSTSQVGTVTFGQNPFVGPGSGLLYGVVHGLDTSIVYTGAPFVVRAGPGSTLPTGLTAGTVYFMSDASGGVGTPGSFYIATSPYFGNPGVGGAPMVGYTNSGTGSTNVLDVSYSNQPVQFQTTGTLPNGLTAGDILNTAGHQNELNGTIYYAVGVSVTANTFAIHSGNGVPIASTASTGSGTHSGLWTKFAGDRTDCQRIKCVSDTSENKAFTTHAACGTVIQDCISYDTKGMAFFMEDGSEERNQFVRNFALKVRNPVLQSDTLKDFDKPAQDTLGVTTGSSAHWWTNMYNQFIDNYGADCDGVGAFNSAGKVQDLSALVNIDPTRRPVLRWLRNGGHSNNFNGIITAFGIDDAFGRNTIGTTNLVGDATTNVLGFPGNLMESGVAWKNRQGGYQNVLNPDGPFYKGWMTGDNAGGDFQGSMNPALNTATSILMVGQSLNDGPLGDIADQFAGNAPNPRFGNATYHFTLPFTNVAYQNYPWVRGYYKRSGQQDYGGGAYAWRDLYTDAVAPQRKHSRNNRFNNSHPGHLTRADRYTGYPITLTIANPCILTPNNVGTSDKEFLIFEGEPIRFVRTTGTLPSPFVKDVPYYAKNVRNAGGTLVGVGVLGVSCELSLTVGGASVSTAASTQSGNHSAFPMWVTPHVYWVRGMGTMMPDLDGDYIKAKTGTAPGTLPQWVCPYGDNPFFASGATGFTYVDPDASRGLDAWGFSTSDFFVGLQNLTMNYGGSQGMKLTRVTPTTLTPIGSYAIDNFPPDTTGYFFQNFQTAGLLNIRGSQTWYQIEPGYMPDGTVYTMPTTLMAASFTNIQDPSSNMMLGFKFSGSSTITSVFRTLVGAVLTADVPTGPSAGSGQSVTCSPASGANNAAKLAAVAADSTGSLYLQDIPNNIVWVKHMALPSNATEIARINALRDSDPSKDNNPAWVVIKA